MDSNDRPALAKIRAHFYETPKIGSNIGGSIHPGEGESIVLVNPVDGDWANDPRSPRATRALGSAVGGRPIPDARVEVGKVAV